MDVCDALIVGAGPAGSSCGRILARSGMDVRILDRQVFPRNKICAGWVTPAVFDLLGIDTNDYAADRTLQPINGFRTGVINHTDTGIESRYATTVSYGIRRLEFDAYLLDRVGVSAQTGVSVTSLERQGDFWIVNGIIRTPVLVGAGGHFCPVARTLNPVNQRSTPVVLAQEVEFRMSDEEQRACRVSAEMPELYFCQDLKGYGWVFRKGDYLNVGLGREDSTDLTEHVASFHREMVQRRAIPERAPVPYRGHAYHLRRHAARRVLDTGALLVGDAAGLAYTESGEGIRPAVESGILAADTILEANGNYGKETLEPYRDRLMKRLGQNGRAIGGWLPESLRHYMGRRLLANAWFARHVVLDRWFLRVAPR